MTFGLTPLQRAALQIITELTDETGMPPTLQTIADELELSNRSQAHRLVSCLEARGWIAHMARSRQSLTILHRPDMPDFRGLFVATEKGIAHLDAARTARVQP